MRIVYRRDGSIAFLGLESPVIDRSSSLGLRQCRSLDILMAGYIVAAREAWR
jgi:hypothetical protein